MTTARLLDSYLRLRIADTDASPRAAPTNLPSPTASLCSTLSGGSLASLDSVDSFHSAVSAHSVASTTTSMSSGVRQTFADFKKEFIMKLAKYNGAHETTTIENEDEANWWIGISKPQSNGTLKYEMNAILEQPNMEKIFVEVTQTLWDESLRSNKPFVLTPFQPTLSTVREMFQWSELCTDEIGLTCLFLHAKMEMPKLLKEMQIDETPPAPRLHKSVPILAPVKQTESAMAKSTLLPAAEKKQNHSRPQAAPRSYFSQFTSLATSMWSNIGKTHFVPSSVVRDTAANRALFIKSP